MLKLKHFLLTVLIFSLSSCQNEQRNSYAIKDFEKTLQPFLFKIVTTGIVTYYDSSLIKSITDDELKRLTRTENPVLRATALGEMLDRKSFNQFEVVMNHLDDTAIVAVDNGEFGIGFRRVSDYLLGLSLIHI